MHDTIILRPVLLYNTYRNSNVKFRPHAVYDIQCNQIRQNKKEDNKDSQSIFKIIERTQLAGMVTYFA